jgi:hypothetical protein
MKAQVTYISNTITSRIVRVKDLKDTECQPLIDNSKTAADDAKL